MGNSGLVVYTKLSPNHSGKRTRGIDRITPHCVAGQLSAEGICACFADAGRKASCNYGIGMDGRISLVVEEKNRSWCSSSSANDQRAVTIECASGRSEPYAMNEAVYAALVSLCADICRRSGKTRLLWFGNRDKSISYEPKADEMVITVHRWFANKSCPGDWLYNRLGDLAAKVTAMLGNPAEADKRETGGMEQSPAKFPYRVKVKISDLCIRGGAGTNFRKKGVTGKGAFTIVDEADGQMDSMGKIGRWGLLKSFQKNRDGWICLSLGDSVTEKI